MPSLDGVRPVLPAGSTLVGSVEEALRPLLLLGLRDMASKVEKKLAVGLVFFV